jgi:hypothetical protein
MMVGTKAASHTLDALLPSLVDTWLSILDDLMQVDG